MIAIPFLSGVIDECGCLVCKTDTNIISLTWSEIFLAQLPKFPLKPATIERIRVSLNTFNGTFCAYDFAASIKNLKILRT